MFGQFGALNAVGGKFGQVEAGASELPGSFGIG